METKPDALLGVRVLDLSRVLAGPFLTMLLADMGAEIIKLEVPGRGDDAREFPPFLDGQSMYYVNLNRGKKSITLNLKRTEGKKVFVELVKRCDVLLENFRPGTMERLGLSYDDLKKVNPRLVYASISGFGQTGPYRRRPGYDIIGQAMGGLMSITGWPDSPPTRAGTAIGDILSALYTCIGILAALQVREKTGEGQTVDVALVDSVYASLENIPQKVFVEGEVPGRIGNRYEFIYPYDSFEARDGWVIIGIANDAIWKRFLETTGMEVLDDPKFVTNPSRVDHYEPIRDAIRGWVSARSVDEVVSKLNGNGIPSCPIYDLKQASEDPHIGGARGMTVEWEQPGLGEVTLLGNPIKMSATDPVPRGPAPELGGDTNSVLENLLGLSRKEIDELREHGVL
jgi:formyl-CoA transferase